MWTLSTILAIALACEALTDFLGTLGFLIFAMTALFLSCIAEKRKVGSKCRQLSSNICVRN